MLRKLQLILNNYPIQRCYLNKPPAHIWQHQQHHRSHCMEVVTLLAAVVMNIQPVQRPVECARTIFKQTPFCSQKCATAKRKKPGNARSYKIRQSGGEGELLMFPCICRLLLPMSFEMNISSNQHHTVMHQSLVNWPSTFSQICCYLCLQHAISNDAKGRSTTTTTTTTNNTSEKSRTRKQW